MSVTSISWLTDGGWALIGGAIGFGAKALFDSALKKRDQINLETWKIKTRVLEQRLTGFYWPLFAALQRDKLLWQKVFYDLRASSNHAPSWVTRFSDEHRKSFARKLELEVLIPNHREALRIIRENMHLANADATFLKLLGRYVRHVDVYDALRRAEVYEIDPIDVSEEYPHGLGEEVERRMLAYQQEYEQLLHGRGILDLREVLTDAAKDETAHTIVSSKD